MSFKSAIQEYGKEITASFVCGGIHYADQAIVSVSPHFDGKLFSSVMRCLDIQIDSISDLEQAYPSVVGFAVAGLSTVGATENGDTSTISSLKFGVKGLGDTEYSYKNFGTYIIKEQKYDDEASTLNLECYDLMLQSMIPYDLSLDYSAGITVKGLLDAICARLSWNIGYTTFTNSDVVIDGEKFDNSNTFRDVLDQIAQVAAGVIAFKDDALCVLYLTDTGEVIDASNLKTLTIGEKYGPVNSIVLARTPQEDNIYARDNDSIAENGLTEIKIANNQIMDSHRDDFIGAILDRINGLYFWLYELESYGIGYLDLCDVFTLETLDGTQYKTIMLSSEMEITQGLTERCFLEAPEVTETDYTAASTTDKLLNKTILRVDKQAQEISAVVSKTDTVAGDVEGIKTTVTRMTEIMVDSDSVDIRISKAVGEIDSITTATGYTFDEDGLRINKDGEEMENLLDNTGMYVNRGDDNILTANHEGVDAINLRSRQFLIIGDNSRIENYGTNRTACFYIGG